MSATPELLAVLREARDRLVSLTSVLSDEDADVLALIERIDAAIAKAGVVTWEKRGNYHHAYVGDGRRLSVMQIAGDDFMAFRAVAGDECFVGESRTLEEAQEMAVAAAKEKGWLA